MGGGGAGGVAGRCLVQEGALRAFLRSQIDFLSSASTQALTRGKRGTSGADGEVWRWVTHCSPQDPTLGH